MPKIALVTVLYNSENVLEGFFKSLSSQTFKDYQLVLVDNNPNEGGEALIKNLSEKYSIKSYTYVRNSVNLGVAKGNNQGIELSLAQGYSHTLLLNNDIEFYQDCLLAEMYLRATSQNEALVVPKIYFYDSKKIWMAGGNFVSYKGIVEHVGEGDEDSPRNSLPKYFDYAPTCFMLVNNDVFRHVGLMDEKYFVYYDDADFIYRAKKLKYKILLMPDLKVFHKVSSSTGGNESLFTIYYFTRNRIYFLRRNFKNVAFIIPIAFTLLTRMIKYFFYSRDQRKEMFKALLDGFRL